MNDEGYLYDLAVGPPNPRRHTPVVRSIGEISANVIPVPIRERRTVSPEHRAEMARRRQEAAADRAAAREQKREERASQRRHAREAAAAERARVRAEKDLQRRQAKIEREAAAADRRRERRESQGAPRPVPHSLEARLSAARGAFEQAPEGPARDRAAIVVRGLEARLAVVTRRTG